MNVAVLIATCGDREWEKLAFERALPSALSRDINRPVRMNHYPDLTVAEARNALAAEAAEDWLCFLDADDELEPGYLDAMEHALSLERVIPSVINPPLLVPKLRRVPVGIRDDDTVGPARIPNQGKWPRVNECVIGTLVHTRLFKAVGGFRTNTDDGTPIAMYEDWDLWLRCWNSGAQLVYSDAVYREHINAAGRNTNAHLSQTVYDAIWADHVADSKTLGRAEGFQ